MKSAVLCGGVLLIYYIHNIYVIYHQRAFDEKIKFDVTVPTPLEGPRSVYLRLHKQSGDILICWVEVTLLFMSLIKPTV